MPEERAVSMLLPVGCVQAKANVMLYARTRALYLDVEAHASTNGTSVRTGVNDFRATRWVAWDENGVHWHVSEPTLEQEEELDYENLAARYKGRPL